MQQLRADVVKILFEPELLEHETQLLPKSFDAECKARIVALGCFDSLVAAVLRVAISEEIASPELREAALGLYHKPQQVLKERLEIAPFYPELFSSIDKRRKRWVYLQPNQRMDVVASWRGVQAYTGSHATDFNNSTLADDGSTTQSER